MSLFPIMNNLFFFFFNTTAPTEFYTLSLHDALPISLFLSGYARLDYRLTEDGQIFLLEANPNPQIDRKSTRLNSSHQIISYAVFCLKKKTLATASPPYPCARRSTPWPRTASTLLSQR